MRLFRRTATAPPEPAPHDDIRAFIPASVRPPDRSMILTAQIEPPETDAPDDDVRFLESLVASVELPAPAPGAQRQALPRVVAPRDEDAALEYFREMKAARTEPERRTFDVPDVDLDDLLEDLSTTAAALRQRKAA